MDIATALRPLRPLLLLAACLMLMSSNWAAAEPPLRAARLGYTSGSVSFSPAGQTDWVQATVNRPLTSGDRLWVDANSRAELQIGGAALRLGANTSVTLLNLDDRMVQVQLSQGTLKARVRRIGQDQAFEVNTPNLAVTLRRAGEYRIDVDPDEDATAVAVQSGRAEVYGDDASYTVSPRQGYRFYGTGVSDYETLATRRDDDLDRWARERDRRIDNSRSARFVSTEVVGYEDLDANGTWRADPNYGNVWTPNRVATGWTPYHDGHWAWVDPWGWTWVDDAPWGYAVSHYGRWANIRGTWSWVPGPTRERAVYAPALVGFVGGGNAQPSASVGSLIAAAIVGWFPLAPREIYQPSYPVSRGYFNNINRSNAVIAPTTITNIYNTTIVNRTTNVTRVVYANQRVQGAVVAVPSQAFTQAQPVARARVAVPKDAAASAPVSPVAAVAPVEQSVRGGARNAGTRPPARDRTFVARTAPPPPPVAFSAQQQDLTAKPGTPIDEGRRRQLKPAAPAATAPKVSVVTTAQAPAPTAPPPATAPASRSRDARRADRTRGDTVRGEAAKGDTGRVDAAKAGAAKAEAARVDAEKAEAAKAEITRGAAAKAAAEKAETARADAAKAETARGDTAKAAAAKAEMARADAAKAETARGDAAKAAAAKAETARADAAKAETARGDAAKAAAAKADSARVDAAKAEASRADSAKAAKARSEESRADAAKTDASRRDATKANGSRDRGSKAEAAKADAGKADDARADAAKAAAAKAEAARVDAAKADAARADAAKAAAAKAEATRAETAKAEATRADAAKAAAAKAEATRIDAAKADATRADAAKAAAAKAEAARVDAAKADAARADAAKAAAAKAEATRADAAKSEITRADAAKAAAAKAEANRAAKAAIGNAASAGTPPTPKPATDGRTEEEKANDRKKGGDKGRKD